ncbi:hypothetical protein KC331_g35 [Hortaea werneckii]|nr:hypothetical protein KC331_g35 [Hortaea werneckii]
MMRVTVLAHLSKLVQPIGLSCLFCEACGCPTKEFVVNTHVQLCASIALHDRACFSLFALNDHSSIGLY